MKRLLALLLLLIVPAGAEAKLKTIAADPYISALVVDAETGQTLFAQNADAPVYPASVLKLMDLLVILDRVAEGRLRLDEQVRVNAEASRTGGSQVYLKEKEVFSIDELLYALMVQSANDAAVALALHIAGSKEGFVTLMNEKARELGMKNTHFHSVHGLPPSAGQEPDVTTANDLALLARALLKRPEVLQYTATRERTFRPEAKEPFIMRNHNRLLFDYQGCDGLKTGFFTAGGFSIVATAQRGGTRIIAIVLGSADRKVRDAKTAELLSRGFLIAPARAGASAPDTVVQPAGPITQAGAADLAVPGDETADDIAEEDRGVSGWWYFAGGMIVGAALGLLGGMRIRPPSAEPKTTVIRRP